MFLRYLASEGLCHPELVGAIPTVPSFRDARLPNSVSQDDIDRILSACDASRHNRLRDRAIILLLVRLGLRADDVVRFRLSDIDWHEASIRLSGKGRRQDWLPLTQEVGDALAAYIEHERPVVSAARVFLHPLAPFRPLAQSTVPGMVRKAFIRAGLPPRGSHVLRHSVATEMLRSGSSLHQIAAVLRHRSIQTTTVYAKVDVAVLSQIAQPWPDEEES
jgi:site-specific recombinase XerD